MNYVFRKTLQSCLTQAYHQGELKAFGTLPLCCVKGTSVVCHTNGKVGTVVPYRTIKNYVRPYRYVLQARRKKEQFMFPERYAKPQPRSTFIEWNYKAELFAFGARLGEQFEDAILREALTDQSYIHKERKKQEELDIDTASLDIKNNDELAELGRSVTEDVLLKFVRNEIPLFPAEGHKALVKHLMSVETMSNVASNLGLKDLILCEEYPPNNETFANAFYAVIGAVRKSSSEERAQKFVIDFIASLLCGKDVNEIWDISRPWALMEEISRQRNLYPVEPRLIRQAGCNTIHAVFVVGVYDKDKTLLGTGIGETVDIAQEMAARDVLKGFFNTRQPQPPFEFQTNNIPYKLVPHVRNISQSH